MQLNDLKLNTVFLCVLCDLPAAAKCNGAGCGKKAVKNPCNLRNPRIKKMKNEPNFNEYKVLQVTALKRVTTLFPKRKRTQTNPIKPIKANFRNGKPAQKQKYPNKKQKNEKQSQFQALISWRNIHIGYRAIA